MHPTATDDKEGVQMSHGPEDLFQQIINEVPNYEVFLTVDELNASSRELASSFPDVVSLSMAGVSRRGEEIPVLKIGSYNRAVFLFGCPHPNEPIGTMMLEYLTRRLAEDESLRELFGYTWYVIKCIDPDGTRLNEGWFKGPFTPRNYAKNFYRPASFDQAEWTFPICYKSLNWQTPIPETKALMKVIDETRPEFMFSLHNAGFGGVYYYVSDECESMYPLLVSLARQQALPLSLGEPEMPYARKLYDAIYAMPSTRDSYEYFAKYTAKDPATIIPAGTSSFDYAKERGTKMTLVCEMPYFYDPRIDDLSETDVTRRKAVLQSIEADKDALSFLAPVLETIKAKSTGNNPFLVPLSEMVKRAPHAIEAKTAWAKRDPAMEKPATQAQLFDNLHVSQFYKCLSLGMLVRAIELESKRGRESELEGVLNIALKALDERVSSLESGLNYQVIPIKKLVSVQLGAALHMAYHVSRQRTSCC